MAVDLHGGAARHHELHGETVRNLGPSAVRCSIGRLLPLLLARLLPLLSPSYPQDFVELHVFDYCNNFEMLKNVAYVSP